MTDEATVEADETYESWTKEQLHDELANRGLLVSGTKDEQITRLEEDDAQAGETESADENVESEPEPETKDEVVPDTAPVPRIPPEGPVLTAEQQTEMEYLQSGYPHDPVTVVWDDKGENPTFVTPDGEEHKSKA